MEGPEHSLNIVRHFAMNPAPGALELHLRFRQHKTAGGAANKFMGEVVTSVIGGDEGQGGQNWPFAASIVWFGSAGPGQPPRALASTDLPALNLNAEHLAIEMLKATRGRGVPIRIVKPNESIGSTEILTFGAPEPAPKITEMVSEAHIVNHPGCYEISHARLHEPGRIGRKLRRSAKTKILNIRHDANGLCVRTQNGDDADELVIAADELLAIMGNSALTTNGSTRLPRVENNSRYDDIYRVARFQINQRLAGRL